MRAFLIFSVVPCSQIRTNRMITLDAIVPNSNSVLLFQLHIGRSDTAYPVIREMMMLRSMSFRLLSTVSGSIFHFFYVCDDHIKEFCKRTLASDQYCHLYFSMFFFSKKNKFRVFFNLHQICIIQI